MKIVFTFLLGLLIPIISMAQSGEYILLEGGVVGLDTVNVNDIGSYLSLLYQTFFTITVLISVVMIIWGGIEYAFSGIPGSKAQGLSRVWSALFGLLIALSSYLILYTINPDLLDFTLLVGPGN